jgi:regulator of RNase E activity RraA
LKERLVVHDKKKLLESFKSYRASDVVDALYFMNAANYLVMDPGMHAIKTGYLMHGYAFTVRYVPAQGPFGWITPEQRALVINDPVSLMFEGGRGGLSDPNQWMTKHIKHRGTLDQVKPDDIFVVDGGKTPHFHWGGGINLQGIASGLAGMICDGGVRDLAELRATDLPIFTRFESAVFHAPMVDLAEVGGIITCGGVQVRPGDIIVGDDDGVVVVPIAMAEEVLTLLPAIKKTDNIKHEEWEKRIKR